MKSEGADGNAKTCTPIHSHKPITPAVTAEQQGSGETSVQEQAVSGEGPLS